MQQTASGKQRISATFVKSVAPGKAWGATIQVSCLLTVSQGGVLRCTDNQCTPPLQQMSFLIDDTACPTSA